MQDNDELLELSAKLGDLEHVLILVSTLSTEKKTDLVDLGFMESRAMLIDIAAFLDRVQRHGQEDDFRVEALREAIRHLLSDRPDRAARVLLHLSDPSSEPIDEAHTQGAAGAVRPADAR